MITPAYAPTATERVLPRMALDFTTGILDPRVTVTRALNTATRVNSNGYIEAVNADLPRFDYDSVTLAPKGLLIEESRANAFSYSQAFATAPWANTGGAVTNNTADLLAPDGANTATKFAPTNAAQVIYYSTPFAYASGATYTLSVFAKSTAFTLDFVSGGLAQGARVVFNLTNQTAAVTLYGTAATVTTKITAYKDGWYRCSMTIALAATTSYYCQFGPPATGNVYLWGAQLETGAFPTSYIPTTTTSLTRNADVVQMTGTNFSSWYNATSGAILARSSQSVITGTRPSIYISDGTADNIISLRGLAANPELYIKATTDQAQIDAGTLTANSSFGLVGAWATDNCAAAINGGAAVTDTSATIPTVDRMLIGSDGTNYLNGQVERISYWPQRIINAEAQAFSK